MSSEVYEKLAKRLGFLPSGYLPRLLEMMMTPEEGELILDLSLQPDEIAHKQHISEEEVNRKLEDLRLRGLIWPPKVAWPSFKQNFLFGPTWGFLRDMFMITAEKYMSPETFQEYLELMRKFYHAEWCEHSAKFRAENDAFNFRVLPVRKAFERTPEIAPCKVLPNEDAIKVFEDATFIGLIDCPCKVLHQGSHPSTEVCITLNQWGEFTLSRGGGRQISLEEAIAISDAAEEAGLVHTMPRDQSHVMCNCCSCCCLVLNPARKTGTFDKVIIKSHYRSVIDQDLCIGCGDCVDRCNFDAIEMKDDYSSGEPKAFVDVENCFGCGVCVISCPTEAITMKIGES